MAGIPVVAVIVENQFGDVASLPIAYGFAALLHEYFAAQRYAG